MQSETERSPSCSVPEEVEQFLTTHGRTFLLSFRADGSPTGHPMTGRWRDGALYINTYRKSAKVKNLLRDPRVCCLVTTNEGEAPFRVVRIRGRAEPLGSDEEAMAAFEGTDAGRGEGGDEGGEAAGPPSPVGPVPQGMSALVRERVTEEKRIIFRIVPAAVDELGPR